MTSPPIHTACASASRTPRSQHTKMGLTYIYGCVHTEVRVRHYDHGWVPSPNMGWRMVRDALAHAVSLRGQPCFRDDRFRGKLLEYSDLYWNKLEWSERIGRINLEPTSTWLSGTQHHWYPDPGTVQTLSFSHFISFLAQMLKLKLCSGSPSVEAGTAKHDIEK